jgi:hypothetical protein
VWTIQLFSLYQKKLVIQLGNGWLREDILVNTFLAVSIVIFQLPNSITVPFSILCILSHWNSLFPVNSSIVHQVLCKLRDSVFQFQHCVSITVV